MSNTYKFELIPLPYEVNDLEPYISAEILNLHHEKHLQTYVNNLNAALENHAEYQSWSLEKLLYNLDKLPAELQKPVRNNGGGVYNHNLYFALMAKESEGPKGSLLEAINRDFGSTEELISKLKAMGLGVFGSGWAWLLSDKEGKLSIKSTANQDTFIPENLFPVIALDVWEHSYYPVYQNRRAEYLDNWVKIINWEKAGELYDMHSSLDYSKL